MTGTTLQYPDMVGFSITVPTGQSAIVAIPRDDEGKTGPYYHGGQKRDFAIPGCEDIGELLNRLDVMYLGPVEAVTRDSGLILVPVDASSASGMKPSAEAHLSKPRRFKSGHEKAGQEIPGTGGNLTRTWTIVTEVVEGKKYTAFFTITATKTPFRVDAKLYNQVAGQLVVGHVSAFQSA